MHAPKLVLASMLCAFGGSVALASGGGGTGMGEMPSASTPAYDAATEYRKGVDALQASKFAEARKAFDHVLSVAPKDANAAFLAGRACEGLNDVKAARRYFERAVRTDGAMTQARRQLGLTLLKLGDKVKAQAQLDALKAADAQCAGSCKDAADIRDGIDSITAAMSTAADAAPAAPSQLMPGRSAAAGDAAYSQAVALINEHRYDQAIAALHAAEQAFGPHPDILTYLGFSNRKLGRYDVAEGYYRQALALAPRHHGALEYYGELKVERGDMAGARANLALLDRYCSFGCSEAEELRHWIAVGHDPAS